MRATLACNGLRFRPSRWPGSNWRGQTQKPPISLSNGGFCVWSRRGDPAAVAASRYGTMIECLNLAPRRSTPIC